MYMSLHRVSEARDPQITCNEKIPKMEVKEGYTMSCLSLISGQT